MAAVYKQFLASPSPALLAENATLHYITTTTTVNGASDIVKHLGDLAVQMKKKKEEMLVLVEGQNSIAAQVDTCLEFLTGAGPYLPGLDENFIMDRTVYLAITHFVNFNTEGKIAQIRQSWDQGALLKQMDVIGKTGRNWPIRDSREQITMITSAQKSASMIAPVTDPKEAANRSRVNSHILRDPHASLVLFGSREEIEQANSAVVSPYAGSRPHQRSFTDILGDQPEAADPSAVVSPYAGQRPSQRGFVDILGDQEGRQVPDSPSAGRERSMSPSKAVAPKAGAGKNFGPSRLFDADENSDPSTPEHMKAKSPEKFVRPDPRKYKHFEFADGTDPQDTPRPGMAFDSRPKSKHDSNWSFDDFVTPQKAQPTRALRHQDVRHWDTEAGAVPETPAQRAAQKPRRDAETHFELQDDGISQHERPVARPRGSAHNEGLHLYDSKVIDDGTDATPEPNRALGNITNLRDRRRDFDSQFSMTDDSPSQPSQAPSRMVGEDRMKVVKMMDSSWGAYDESPASQKENNPRNGSSAKEESRGISIAGDGMGGKKGTNRNWLYGDEDEAPRAVPGKKPGASQKSSMWDF